jgi:hypothetical protein
LSTNNGSLDSFHESCLCGANPNARHTRETIDWLNPRWVAIDRVDQCVASAGVVSNVAVIKSLIRSSPTTRGRPGRGSSSRPSQRSTTNRLRHRRTVVIDNPSRSASSVLVPPSAAANTIRDRIANPAAPLRRRAHPSNSVRSSAVNTISAA